MYSKQLFSKCKLFFSFFLDGVGTGGKLSLPILIIYFFSIGKFAQRPNMTKVELISDVQTFLDQVIEIHYENNENFVTPNSKTNVVIAAFTTAYARLKLYGVLDELQERVLYYDTDSVIFVSKPGEPGPPIGPYLGQLTDELKEGYRGITLNCTARQKVNFDVIRELVYLHAVCKVNNKVTVDIPYKITRNTKTKSIETKRTKKDYRIVYNKRVIIDDYKTLPYGY